MSVDSCTNDNNNSVTTLDDRDCLSALFGESLKSSHSVTLNALFGDDSPEKSDTSNADLPVDDASSTKDSHNPLASLFGESSSDSVDSSLKALFTEPTSDVHFCKDCRYFISHPFECRCALTERVVNPTDDCSRYCPPALPH